MKIKSLSKYDKATKVMEAMIVDENKKVDQNMIKQPKRWNP
jgi:hypothetical protein